MKNEGDELETPLTWLTVGGCPRSGTTALGAVLNAHPKITLLHEYDQADFFNTVSAFFREEDRLGEYPDTEGFELLLRRARHEVDIARAVFREVTGKDASIMGTKFPGAHLWPQPVVPDGMLWKQIHITRNPYAVITSYANKMLREGYEGGRHEHIFDTACAHWVSAWNHAVDRQHELDFMHLIYEELPGNITEADRLASFLGIESGIDFGPFRSSNKSHSDLLADLALNGFESCLDQMTAFDVCKDWQTFVAARCKMGFPIRAGEVFDFSAGSNSWKLPAYGFYPPERDGQWIQGEKGTIHFSPCFSCEDCLLTMEITWALDAHGIPPIIEIELNGFSHVQVVSLGERNGLLNRFHWVLRDLSIKAGQQLTLNLRALNPRNSLRLGIGQDDRELSVMIRSLRFDPL